MNDMMGYIRKRFPDKSETIALLMTKDPDFRAICEDYRDCIHALRHWDQSKEPEAEARVNEYRTLIGELEDEINQALITLKPRWLE